MDQHPQTETLEDPMVTFIREVVSAIPCAAHMSMDPWQDEPYETFAEYFPKHRFIPTPVGVYCHVSIFRGDDRPYGVYFPQFTADDLTVPGENGEPLIENLLSYDQPVLYLNAGGQAGTRMQELFTNPPANRDSFRSDWLHAATTISTRTPVVGEFANRLSIPENRADQQDKKTNL